MKAGVTTGGGLAASSMLNGVTGGGKNAATSIEQAMKAANDNLSKNITQSGATAAKTIAAAMEAAGANVAAKISNAIGAAAGGGGNGLSSKGAFAAGVGQGSEAGFDTWQKFMNETTPTTGFASGGGFKVGGNGGTDSQLVGFKASPNERVTVETPAQQRYNDRRTAGRASPQGAGGVTIINQVNPAQSLDAMRTAAGRRVLHNNLASDPEAVRRILGID